MLTENLQSTDRVGAEYKYKCNTRESRAKCTALESIHSGVDIVPPTSCLEPILTNSTSQDDGDDVDGVVEFDDIHHHQPFHKLPRAQPTTPAPTSSSMSC